MNAIRSYDFDSYASEVIFFDHFDSMDMDEKTMPLLVCDENTDRLFGGGKMFRKLPKVVLPTGEESKCWESVSSILQAALKNGLGRDSLIIALGGGIICDLSAFAASVYMRGCRTALVPTTLLAMVDASLGGKTGFNFGGFKNMIGTFYPAEKIFIVTESLHTLPTEEILAGTAENIKHACLGDERLFTLLENGKEAVLHTDADIIREIIERSLSIKADIVKRDLRESGVRAHLNLGHTFAHALESIRDLRGSGHGQAVAWGLSMAMKAGVEAGITDPVYAERVRNLLRLYGYRLEYDIDPHAFLAAVRQDKKKREGKVRFVLQEDLGRTLIAELDDETLVRVITDRT